jgi:hypothetical protein
VKWIILLFPVVAIISSIFGVSLFQDLSRSNSEYLYAEYIIHGIYSRNDRFDRFIERDKVEYYLDIEVEGGIEIVRLSDGFHSKKWEPILRNYGYGDTLKVLFPENLLHESILYNPGQVVINNDTIISLSETKNNLKLLILLTAGCFLFSVFIWILALRSYNSWSNFKKNFFRHGW